MPNEYMSIDYLLHTEEIVEQQTSVKIGRGNDALTDSIKILFKLSNFLNEDYEIESDDNAFHTLAYKTYLQLPYTLKVIQDLYVKGYYLESIILARNVVENFAKLRYFSNHKDLVTGHLTAKRPSDRISLRAIFEEVAPGYYDLHYGRVLSGFMHGDLITLSTRVVYTSPTEGRVIYGCEFNLTYAAIAFSIAFNFSYGYLNYIDVFSPSILKKLPTELYTNYENILRDQLVKLDSPYDTPNHEKEWKEVVRPFVVRPGD